jgi:hypothetical protein
MSSNSSQTGTGGDRRSSQRGKSTSSRRRNSPHGPVVRIAIGAVVDGFRVLPAWARQQAASAMMAVDPSAFEAQGSTPSQSTTNLAPSLSGKPSDASSSKNQSSSKPAVGKTTTDQSEGGQQTAIRQSTAKLKGFNRPEVRGMEYARRLRNHPTGYTATQQRLDEKLLSSALQAVGRGSAAGVGESEIASALASVTQSTESYRKLWPSRKTRKEYALAHPPPVQRLPLIQCVDDDCIVYTPHQPAVSKDVANEDASGGDDSRKYPSVSLQSVPFHDSGSDPPPLTKELVTAFIRGSRGNYSSLAQKVFLLNGRIALYWIRGVPISGTRWADQEDDEIVLPVSPAKTPPIKKRKTTADG